MLVSTGQDNFIDYMGDSITRLDVFDDNNGQVMVRISRSLLGLTKRVQTMTATDSLRRFSIRHRDTPDLEEEKKIQCRPSISENQKSTNCLSIPKRYSKVFYLPVALQIVELNNVADDDMEQQDICQGITIKMSQRVFASVAT